MLEQCVTRTAPQKDENQRDLLRNPQDYLEQICGPPGEQPSRADWARFAGPGLPIAVPLRKPDVRRTQIFILHRTERLRQSAKRTQFQAMEQNEANSDDFNGCWLQG
jgi:hypothetical protein